jgi:hypothetical protein
LEKIDRWKINIVDLEAESGLDKSQTGKTGGGWNGGSQDLPRIQRRAREAVATQDLSHCPEAFENGEGYPGKGDQTFEGPGPSLIHLSEFPDVPAGRKDNGLAERGQLVF